MTSRLRVFRCAITLLALIASCSGKSRRTGPSDALLVVGYDREPDTMNRYSTHILEDIQSCVVEGLVTADERETSFPSLPPSFRPAKTVR